MNKKSKFTVRFRPIREEIVSSMYNKFYLMKFIELLIIYQLLYLIPRRYARPLSLSSISLQTSGRVTPARKPIRFNMTPCS